MVQLPSPPVVQGEIGKTPPSKVSFSDPDMQGSLLGCCDGANVKVKAIVGPLLVIIAEGGVVVGLTVFLAVGSVVSTLGGGEGATVGPLLGSIAEGGVVVGLIVGTLLGSIPEGGVVDVLIVFAAVGSLVSTFVGSEGMCSKGGNAESKPCSLLDDFPLFDDFANLPKIGGSFAPLLLLFDAFPLFDDLATSSK
jgi:hypothetical protein